MTSLLHMLMEEEMNELEAMMQAIIKKAESGEELTPRQRRLYESWVKFTTSDFTDVEDKDE